MMRTAKTSAPETSVGHAPVQQAQTPLRSRGLRKESYIGNQAMLRRLSQTRPHVQYKLEIGAVSDPLETEADRVAEHVMRVPGPPVEATAAVAAGSVGIAHGAVGLHRKCAACEDEDRKLSRKPSGDRAAVDGGEAPPIVHEVLRSPGEPLDPAARAFFEPRFGADLGSVRVHSHELARSSARAVNALAYTVGNHIVFGEGQYAPGTVAGHRLLAHEIAHVIQQTGFQPVASPRRNSSMPIFSSGPQALSRATVKIGTVSAEVDYGDLINIPASGYVTAIQSRYQSYTGAALAAATVTQITAFTPRQQEWVLFALDVLSENTAQAPRLDSAKAFQRVVDRAPSSTTRALGTASQAFEREVLITSGWAEEAISGRLTAPSAASLAVIDPLLNPPPAATAPPGRVRRRHFQGGIARSHAYGTYELFL